MVRTQIQITEQQDRRLREIARRDEVSLAEAIRRCIDEALERHRPERRELYQRALALAGQAKDIGGADDLSVHHDAYATDDPVAE